MMSVSPSNSLIQVLIVEDVDSMRQLLQMVVEKLPGFKVSGLARNGAEARLELSRRFPSLVLLDEVLPGESGQDLLREFKSLGIRVILLTSLADRTEKLPSGAIGRIFKPSWKNLEDDQARIDAEIRRMLEID